jgi:thiol-disulfide isomerase/thioredoxin
MAAKAKKVELTTVIRDAEHFLSYYNERNPKLLIIDVHPTWSGACEALIPFYKNLQTTVIDEFEKRVDIIMVDQEKLEGLNLPELHSTSKPKILIALQGKIIFTANGPNSTELEEHVKKNVPYI